MHVCFYRGCLLGRLQYTNTRAIEEHVLLLLFLLLLLFTVYDVSGAASDRNCVVLNDIHIDIMDYIIPATCTDSEFRQMWLEFEWENKVAVNTNLTELHAFLTHLIKTTNMKCLTPEKVGFFPFTPPFPSPFPLFNFVLSYSNLLPINHMAKFCRFLRVYACICSILPRLYTMTNA